MESENGIVEKFKFNFNLFLGSYFGLFAIIYLFDTLTLFFIARYPRNFFQPDWHLFLVYYPLIVKMCFQGVEFVRLFIFIKSNKRKKEDAIKVARYFMAYKIYLYIYISVLIIFYVFNEIFQWGAPSLSPPGSGAFFIFYWDILSFILSAQIFLSTTAPSWIILSIDHKDKKIKNNLLTYSILWSMIIIASYIFPIK